MECGVCMARVPLPDDASRTLGGSSLQVELKQVTAFSCP